MFSFIKMKFKTFKQVRSKLCIKKMKSISHQGKISKISQTHQESQKDQGSKVS